MGNGAHRAEGAWKNCSVTCCDHSLGAVSDHRVMSLHIVLEQGLLQGVTTFAYSCQRSGCLGTIFKGTSAWKCNRKLQSTGHDEP